MNYDPYYPASSWQSPNRGQEPFREGAHVVLRSAFCRKSLSLDPSSYGSFDDSSCENASIQMCRNVELHCLAKPPKIIDLPTQWSGQQVYIQNLLRKSFTQHTASYRILSAYLNHAARGGVANPDYSRGASLWLAAVA